MELIRERPISREARYITDWPKVPQSSIATTWIADKVSEIQHQPGHPEPIQESKGNQAADYQRATEEDQVSDIQPPTVEDQRPPSECKDPLKAQAPDRRWLGLRRFTLQKSQWSDPHLSIGIKYNRMGSNECWEAIGPAQKLFGEISQSVGDLLDARVEDIEEGEPVAGHILTFGMYMIGKDISTARPTLIFTCQRPKPRRRAIKFIKESEILHGHPKITLAESAIVPMAQSRNYLRLIASLRLSSNGESLSTTWIHRRDADISPASHGLKASQIAGIVIGAVAMLLGIAVAAIMIICRLNKVVKATTMSQSRTLKSRQSPSTHIDSMSVDPLMMTPSEVSSHSAKFSSPFASRSSPLAQHSNGYNPVPSSETSSSQATSESQSTIINSVPSLLPKPAGYFDKPHYILATTDPNTINPRTSWSRFMQPSRNRTEGNDTSNATEVSCYSGLGTVPSVSEDIELGSLKMPEGSNVLRALKGLGFKKMASWRKKDLPTTNQMSSITPPRHDASLITNASSLVPPKPDTEDRNLHFGHFYGVPPPRRPSQHEREWSNVSNQSEIREVSTGLAEIDIGTNEDLRPHSLLALQSFVMKGVPILRKMIQTSLSPLTPTKIQNSPHLEVMREIPQSSKLMEQVLRRRPVIDSNLQECTSLYGMPITSVATGRRATIGGIVLSKNRYYGLTVDHVFADRIMDFPNTPLEADGNDPEFAFDEEDEEEIVETSSFDIAITSQASMSLASLSRTASSASNDSGSETPVGSINFGHPITSPDGSEIPEQDDDEICEFNVTGLSSSSLPKTGQRISYASQTNSALDWALVELSEASVVQAQAACSKDVSFEHIALPTGFGSMPTNHTEVMVIKGYSGISNGSISSSTTMMKLHPKGTFQEVWTVRLDGDGSLVEGDSGSWVVDATTGDLYGHIVAGVPEAGLAYVIPAYKTVQDIEKCIGPVGIVSSVTRQDVSVDGGRPFLE